MKKKIISVIAGVAGLVVAYFVVSGISNVIYHHPEESATTESTMESAEQGTPSPEVTGSFCRVP